MALLALDEARPTVSSLLPDDSTPSLVRLSTP